MIYFRENSIVLSFWLNIHGEMLIESTVHKNSGYENVKESKTDLWFLGDKIPLS